MEQKKHGAAGAPPPGNGLAPFQNADELTRIGDMLEDMRREAAQENREKTYEARPTGRRYMGEERG